MEQELEIDVKTLCAVVCRKIWIVLLTGIGLAAIVFLISNYAIDKKYEATTKIYMLSKQDHTSGFDYSDLMSSSYILKDYRILITSRPVAEQVIAKLGLTIGYDELVKLIRVENPEDTRILYITAEYKDPYTAKMIADSIREASERLITAATGKEQIGWSEEAKMPEMPSSPDVARSTFVGGAVGMVAAAFIILLLYVSDDTVKTPEDAEKHLGIKVLGVIPVRKKELFERNWDGMRSSLNNERDAYNGVRSRIRFYGRDMKIIGITGCSREEGGEKSIASLNLAVSMANAGKRTVLVDADLNETMINEIMNSTYEEGGLSKYLLEERQVDDIIQPTDVKNLDLVYSGRLPDSYYPDDLLCDKHFSWLIDELSRDYDYVLVNLPAYGKDFDGTAAAKVCDAVLLAIKEGSTKYREVRMSEAGLKEAGCKVLGAVLLKECRLRIRICFAASSGGHFEQLMMLKPIMDKYESFLITEKTKYLMSGMNNRKAYYLKQVNRKEWTLPLLMLMNFIKSLWIFIKEKPDVIITTGVLSVIPISLIAKIFGKKLIYVESYAKITTPTKTGRFLYRCSDQFYVQWEELLKLYPKAIYKGGIY